MNICSMPRALRAATLAAGCGALLSVSSFALQAASLGQQDGPPQKLLDELHTLVDKAERERSADRDFLAALRNYIDKYDQPWSRTILNDAFADGDYTRSPAWTVTQGDFRVDRRYGLFSRPSASNSPSNTTSSGNSDKGKVAEQLATALLGSLLNQGQRNQSANSASSQTSAPRGEARIATAISASSVFAVELDVSSLSADSALQIGMAQSAGSQSGYRLQMEADGRLQLIRLDDRGSAILDSADVGALTGTSRQRVRWTRGRTGRMRVELNGRTVLDATDRTNSTSFGEFSLVNIGGEIGVRQVAIATARSQ